MKNTLAYLRNLKKTLPTIVGNEAVNAFQDNIKQGIDINGNPFKKRAGDFEQNKGRTPLTQRGNLRRSIRITRKTPQSVVIGSSLPYAKIHNEGGKIIVTEKMRKFFWAKVFEAEKKAGKFSESTKDSQIRRYKKANKEVIFWRAMLKKDSIDIPQRQYAGGGFRLQQRIKKAIFNTTIS